MADVSVIKDLTGTSYNIKDSAARSGLSGKLDANQGSANAGKVLGIDTDGSVIPVEGGGGSDLPPVTSSDNGKALGVVEGEWAATDIFAPKASPVFTGSISLGRSSGSTVGSNSFAVGSYLTASGNNSHAEGSSTTASGSYSHAEGANTYASGTYSHAENNYSKACGYASHAEGDTSLASNNAAHSEGYNTIACAANSHAEGGQTKAVGANSHAEGGSTEAYGIDSHAEGFCTIAIGSSEHVSGQYNVADTAPAWVSLTSYSVGDIVSREESFVDADNVTRTKTVIYKCVTANSDETFTSSKWTAYGKYLEVVGNGKTTSDRSNARALDWDGNEYLKGDIYVGCNKNSANGTKLTPPVAMTGATSSTAGSAGYVPAPSAGDEGKYLKGDGTWGNVDIPGKADKVANATAGDVATLDSSGNLVDSGKTLGVSVPSDAVFTDTNTWKPSKEFMPSANDSLLTWLYANMYAGNLPFSFVKIGSATMSDTPSAIGGSEFTGIVTGNGARMDVRIAAYASGSTFERRIFNGAWNGDWVACGTVTGITMNGASKGTSGVVDLGTVITAHQDISGKLDKSTVKCRNSGNWWEAPTGYPIMYKYEGANTTTYKLPYQHVIVLVMKESASRGCAVAISWPNATNSQDIWVNGLHDSWTGWKTRWNDSGWVTPATNCKYRKIANFVTVVATGSASSETTLFTLPEGYRPPIALRVANYDLSGASNCHMYIGTNGNVNIVPTGSGTKYLTTCTTSFITA